MTPNPTSRSSLFRVRYPYSDPVTRQQAQTTLWVVWVLAALATLILLGFFTSTLVGGRPFNPNEYLGISILPIAFTATLLVQAGRVRLAGFIVVALLTVLIVPGITVGFLNDRFALAIPLTLALLLLNWQDILFFSTVVALLGLQILFTNTSAEDPALVRFLLSDIGLYALLAFLLITVRVNISRISEENIRERHRLSRLANAPFRQSQDEQSLISNAVRFLREELFYNHAQVYLVDDSQMSAQRVVTGLGISDFQGGIESVDLTGASSIAEAIRTSRRLLTNQNSAELRRRHLLPSSRSSLLLPLVDGERVLGVLDVQQSTQSTFSSGEQEALQLVAAELGNRIGQSRQNAELRDTILEQEALILRQRERLSELERSERMVTIGTWRSFLQQRGAELLGYDIDAKGAVEFAENITPAMTDAIASEDLVTLDEHGATVISVPIILRNQTLGAMAFTLPPERTVSARQIELVRSVVQRLGLALENRRLFEQTQQQAVREAKASEVTSLLLSSTQVEAVLALAAERFNELLGAVHTQITLQPSFSSGAELDKPKPAGGTTA